MSLGLDELMIVNPAANGMRAVFFGRDGRLYGLTDDGDDRLFLGDGGSLYQVGSAGSPDPGRYFLGDDGTLYERLR